MQIQFEISDKDFNDYTEAIGWTPTIKKGEGDAAQEIPNPETREELAISMFKAYVAQHARSHRIATAEVAARKAALALES